MAGHVSVIRHRSRIGDLVLGAFEGRLCLLDFEGRRTRRAVDERIRRCLGAGYREQRGATLDEAVRQLEEYLDGARRAFDLPVLSVGTDFQRCVWDALRGIPYGSVATYAQVARAVGRERAVRAVAGAVRANPLAVVVPCHRVIGSDGSLTGYAGGLAAKGLLLGLERAPGAR